MVTSKIFCANILIFASLIIEREGNQNDFTVLKNQDINLTVRDSSLISSVYKSSRMQCATVCSVNSNCKTAVYDKGQERLMNCFTYNRYFQTSELVPFSTGVVYQKKSSKIKL